MITVRKLVATAVIAAIPTTVIAETGLFVDPMDGQFDVSRFLSERAYGFLPVPIVITDPALEGGLGMMGLFFNETDEARDKRLKMLQSDEGGVAHLLPPNVTALAAFGTGNESWGGGIGHLGFWKQGSVRYTGGAGYGDINLDFYGLGPLQLERPVDLNTTTFGVMQSLRFRLGESKMYLGPMQRYFNAEMQPNNIDEVFGLEPDGQLADRFEDILTFDTTTSGLGFTFEYDSRDSIFSPEHGYYYTLNAIRFDEAIGSDHEYNLYELDGQNYWSLSDRWRLGLRLQLQHADSDGLLPPYAAPNLKMRGVPIGTIQGLIAQSMEAVLTYVVNERWRVLMFGGIGRVANDESELDDAENYDSQGAGMRYQIARRYGLYVGLDVAKGPEDWVFYIQTGTSW